MPPALQDLAQRNPEWRPWLTIVGEVIAEIDNAGWAAAVPATSDTFEGRQPLLADASIRLDRSVLDPLVHRVLGAGRSAERAFLPALTVFEHAANGNHDALLRLAAELGAEPDTFAARAALVPLPFLHACRARWSHAIPQGWAEGYCPICAGWPAFAEVRGVERMRYLRCARCGSAWQTSLLRCPYCATTDHDTLQSLIVEGSTPPSTIEACTRCRGYVKSFSTLQGSAAATVMLQDLSSAELDFSAARRGYHRPGGLGHALRVTLSAEGSPS